MCKKKKKCTKENDDTMASIAKLSNRAFLLKSDKIELFLSKDSGSDKVMRRFFAYRPKDGVTTPLKKGKNV